MLLIVCINAPTGVSYIDTYATTPGGSLFLFDRKVLRYFRKDGHNWRKKKDGKTVKEAHEKLKVILGCLPATLLHFQFKLKLVYWNK